MKLLSFLTELKQSTLTDLRRIFKSGRFEQVGYWLASNGWKTDEAHEGYYSKVYLNPQSNLVIKMLKQGLAMREMDEMRCQLNWLRYANKNWQDNPHLPRVHYIQTAQEKDIDHEDTGNTGYLVVMERLEKARDPYAGMSDEDRDDFASMLSVHMHGEPHEYMPYIEQPKDDWTMTPQEYELAHHSRLMGRGRSTYQRQLGGGKYQQLAQALEAMDKMRRRFGCHGDLHSGNVMLRPGTNELVVNDPFEG